MTLAGKRVWVTGGSSGIGAALARELADRGAVVAISARRAEKLREVAAHSPDRITAAPLDVTDHAAVGRVFAGLVADLGGVDAAVLNAGTWTQTRAGSWDHGAFSRQVTVNLLGTSACLEVLIPHLLARGDGRLVGVASVAGYRGIPGAEGYGATKAALLNLFESLRADLSPHGILVQAVSPGFVRTELTEHNDFPMPFMVDADDAARAIADGMEGTAPEIVFPTAMAVTMKAARLVPGRLWTRLWSRRSVALR